MSEELNVTDETFEPSAENVAEVPERTAPTRREGVTPTGNEGVDEVLESLEALEDLPIGEHVAVFEAAHEGLRSALAARPAAAPDSDA